MAIKHFRQGWLSNSTFKKVEIGKDWNSLYACWLYCVGHWLDIKIRDILLIVLTKVAIVLVVAP